MATSFSFHFTFWLYTIISRKLWRIKLSFNKMIVNNCLFVALAFVSLLNSMILEALVLLILVSVNYTIDAGEEAALQQDTTGVPVHHWQSVVENFDMLTALIDECDLVISVPQTAVHQRGALGKECWVLTSYYAPWTFGLDRNNVIWYPKQTRQFRQLKGEEDYTQAIRKCAFALAERTGAKEIHEAMPIIPDQEFEIRVSPVC